MGERIADFLNEALWDGWKIQADRRRGLWDQIHEWLVEKHLPESGRRRRGIVIFAIVVTIVFVVLFVPKESPWGSWLRTLIADTRQKLGKRAIDGTWDHPLN